MEHFTALSGSPFSRKPLKETNGIPVYSEFDAYVGNYELIAKDHIQGMSGDNENPWIDSDSWAEMEAGTVELALKYAKLAKPDGPLKLLDIGVGLGRLLKKIRDGLAGTDCHLHGMDVALPYLVRARDKGLNVVMSKIEDIPYRDSYFDIVTCTDVLEHVLDLNLCVNKCLSVLKPGGYLIVRVPNREDLSAYLRRDYPYEMAHLRSFDQPSLELLFSRVFKQTVLEFKPGLHQPSWSLAKYRLPVRGYSTLMNLTLRICERTSRSLYKKMLEQMFYPVEINVVVQKTS